MIEKLSRVFLQSGKIFFVVVVPLNRHHTPCILYCDEVAICESLICGDLVEEDAIFAVMLVIAVDHFGFFFFGGVLPSAVKIRHLCGKVLALNLAVKLSADFEPLDKCHFFVLPCSL
jgi:hypothetical protein